MMYFMETVCSRRAFIYHRSPKLNWSRRRAGQEKNSHRVVILLKKVAHGDDGLRVGREATEEVDKILVVHARLEKFECSLVQRRIHGGSKTLTCGGQVSSTP